MHKSIFNYSNYHMQKNIHGLILMAFIWQVHFFFHSRMECCFYSLGLRSGGEEDNEPDVKGIHSRITNLLSVVIKRSLSETMVTQTEYTCSQTKNEQGTKACAINIKPTIKTVCNSHILNFFKKIFAILTRLCKGKKNQTSALCQKKTYLFKLTQGLLLTLLFVFS